MFAIYLAPPAYPCSTPAPPSATTAGGAPARSATELRQVGDEPATFGGDTASVRAKRASARARQTRREQEEQDATVAVSHRGGADVARTGRATRRGGRAIGEQRAGARPVVRAGGVRAGGRALRPLQGRPGQPDR